MKKSVFNKTTNNQKDIDADSISCKSISVNGVDIGGSLLTESSTNTLTNKTLSGSANTLTNIQDGSLSNNIPKKDVANTFTSSGNSFAGTTEYLILKSNGTAGNNCSFLTSDSAEWMTCNNTTKIVNFPLAHVNFIGQPRINNIAMNDVTETLTNKTISGSANTISNIQDSSLSANIPKLDIANAFTGNISTPNITVTNLIQCQSIRNITSGTDEFEFLNDSGVKVASYNNESGFFTSDFGFNVVTGKDYMINSVPIQQVAQTLQNKTLDTSCVVPNGALERGVIKSISTISNPTVDNDIGEGYQELSLWNNSINNTCFICVERFSGAAIWKKIMLDDTVLSNEIDSTTSITTTNQVSAGSLVVDTVAINGNEISTAVGDLSLNPTGSLDVIGDIKINNTRVITDQQGAIANASETTASNTTKINEILAALRNHGLINT